MPTKRNNDTKEFAIGTKIEYNGKLYEVARGKYCNDCSIASICSSNDITSGNRIGDVLSRDKRLSIFGECSSITRDDNISVVFKEIPKNINLNIIQPLVKADNTVEALQIKAPNNFEIDVESSDLSKGIINFKNKWLTIEQLYKSAKDNNYHTYLSEIKDSKDDKSCTVRDKLIALSNLMDIASYFNGDWNYDANGNDCGYIIAYDKTTTEPYGYQIVSINADTDMYFGNIVFKNEADVQYVIDNPNFRNILDKIFKV